MVSETPLHTETLLYFGTDGSNNTGVIAYNNYETVLNKMCKDLYSKTDVGIARSMTFEDVAKVTGWSSVPHNDTWAQYLGYSDYAEYSQGHSLTNAYRPDFNNGTSADSSSHTFYNTWDYFHIYQATTEFGLNPNDETINIIFGTDYDWYYFLATRMIFAGPESTTFHINSMGAWEVKSSSGEVFKTDGTSGSFNNAIRPVILINSNVQIEQRAGTSEEPHHII